MANQLALQIKRLPTFPNERCIAGVLLFSQVVNGLPCCLRQLSVIRDGLLLNSETRAPSVKTLNENPSSSLQIKRAERSLNQIMKTIQIECCDSN